MEGSSHYADASNAEKANLSPMQSNPLKPEIDPKDQLDNGAKAPLPVPTRLQRWNSKIESLAGLEARGITRVEPHERQAPSLNNYIQMSLIWFSANVTANNLALGLLGPLVYDLGFTDAALCAVFGGMVGCMGASVMSVWGAKSGNRTMIVARYFMGYYPSKITVLLNMVVMIGYGMLDTIVSGQILSAVSGGSMTVIVGIVISAVITYIVTVFGIKFFHYYERWAWLPQIIVLFVLVGSAGSKFNASSQSTGDSVTINANRLSFFSLCLSAPITWVGAASDFYVYYPETTASWKSFMMTSTGMTLAFSFVYLLGVGLASGIPTEPSWSDAYDTSSGALILAGYNGLGGFGKFCAVIVALGPIANNIPGTYSAALGCQMLGRYGQGIPRYVWTTVIVLIYTIIALASRNHLFDIFEDWLALMGYWASIFITIVLEENFIFRRSQYDWSAWNDRSRLPIGLAALAAFCIGWVGSVLGMDQVYFIGPVGKQVGAYGADLGIWMGTGFCLVAYPPLRYLELKFIGR